MSISVPPPASQSPLQAARSPAPGDLAGAVLRFADARVDIAPGAWDAGACAALHGARLGAMVLDGLLLREVRLAEVPAAAFVLPGEVVDPSARPSVGPAGEDVTWSAVEATQVAVLGERFVAATRRYPALLYALHRCQADQLHRAGRTIAIAQLPRVEQRVLAMFCALAEDRGRVLAEGVVVDVSLTHETIGRLVGARRPTVSLALKTLAEDGLLLRRDRGWLIGRRATDLALLAGGPLPVAA